MGDPSPDAGPGNEGLAGEVDAEPGAELLGVGERTPDARERRADLDRALDAIAAFRQGSISGLAHGQPPGCRIARPVPSCNRLVARSEALPRHRLSLRPRNPPARNPGWRPPDQRPSSGARGRLTGRERFLLQLRQARRPTMGNALRKELDMKTQKIVAAIAAASLTLSGGAFAQTERHPGPGLRRTRHAEPERSAEDAGAIAQRPANHPAASARGPAQPVPHAHARDYRADQRDNRDNRANEQSRLRQPRLRQPRYQGNERLRLPQLRLSRRRLSRPRPRRRPEPRVVSRRPPALPSTAAATTSSTTGAATISTRRRAATTGCSRAATTCWSLSPPASSRRSC